MCDCKWFVSDSYWILGLLNEILRQSKLKGLIFGADIQKHRLKKPTNKFAFAFGLVLSTPPSVKCAGKPSPLRFILTNF